MFIPAVVEFFKYKLVGSIIILTCEWSDVAQVKLIRQLSQYGISSTVSCDPNLPNNQNNHFQGVLYMKQSNDSLMEKVKPEHFASWYKWMIVGEEIPDILHQVRYDADMVLVKPGPYSTDISEELTHPNETVHFFDIYVHPSLGASVHPWACWAKSSGFQLTRERDRILRRKDLQGYPLKIAAPVGHYSQDWYNGTFTQYLRDEKLREQDSTLRCSYGGSSLLVESINAIEILVDTQTWSSTKHNGSTLTLVATGSAQLTGAILRMLPDRIKLLDYIFPIWPFKLA